VTCRRPIQRGTLSSGESRVNERRGVVHAREIGDKDNSVVTTANPNHKFIQADTTDNTAWTSFQLTRDSGGNAKLTEISHSPAPVRSAERISPNR
jgi:hypothetical protein